MSYALIFLVVNALIVLIIYLPYLSGPQCGAPARTFPLCPNCFNSKEWLLPGHDEGSSGKGLDEEDEHKLEFTKIHNDFRKIVEELLEELMTELGISDTQFLEACEKAEQNPIHKKIVD